MANVQKFYTIATDVSSNFYSIVWMWTRCLKQAGWVYKASSDGTATDTTGVAANDKWGGGGTPTSDTYPTSFSATTGPWWVAQGPQVLKFTISSASTGTFIRGEQVSQATTAATGEILGYVFDATNHGWIIVMPRTGSFDGTHVITGSISAATVTPATLITYTQEMCIWKNSSATQQGSIYWIMADASGENTSLFSYLAANAAGVSATVAPGGGGTGNGFPASALCILGAGGSSSPGYWFYFTTPTAHALVTAANATPSSGISADGTGWMMTSTTAGTPSSANCVGIFRLDDTEPGDVCPFEWLLTQGSNLAGYSRTAPSGADLNGVPWTTFYNGNNVTFSGYIGRGVGGTPGTAPDVAAYHAPGIPAIANFSTPFNLNNADILRVQNHPASIKPIGTDTVSLWNTKTGIEQSKGRVRWMRWASAGNVFDTTDSRLWVCWLESTSTSQTSCYVGPWDGSTPPAP
jgi:hypothetical protein